MIILRVLILTICILICRDTSAQKYEFGTIGFMTSYMGDINPNNPFNYNGFGGGLFAKYNFNSTWAIRLGFDYLTLSGNDKNSNNSNQQQRNLSFNNHLSELSLLTEFNFFKFSTKRKFRHFTPYLIGGLGIIKHDPFVYYSNNKIYLRELKVERNKQDQPINYSALAFVIPFGLGFKYKWKRNWGIGIEMNYRVALTDNIDNVSGYYPLTMSNSNTTLPRIDIINEDGTKRAFDNSDWLRIADPSTPNLSNKGTLRGDGKKWDGYMTTGITLIYSIQNTKCTW